MPLRAITAAAVTAAVLTTVPAAASAAAAPLWRYRTISLPGSLATAVVQINDNGVFTGGYVAKTKPHRLQGFIDAHGHITSFSYPAPAWQTRTTGINNQGTTVGFSQHGRYEGWLRSPAGEVTPLNDPAAGTGAGQGTQPQAINDHGVVAGVYITTRGIRHGFVYRSGHFTTVNVPGAYYGQPGWGSAVAGINNAGVMVGWQTPTAKSVVVGYLDIAGQFFSFTSPGGGTRPGDATVADAISNTGVIVGTGNGPGGVQHGWALAGCLFTALKDPHATTAPAKNGSGTVPEGINDHGVVAGIYFGAQHSVHSFLVATGMTTAAKRRPCLP